MRATIYLIDTVEGGTEYIDHFVGEVNDLKIEYADQDFDIEGYRNMDYADRWDSSGRDEFFVYHKGEDSESFDQLPPSLKELYSLDCTGIYMTSLPKMKSLNYLVATDCGLQSLPEGMKKLTYLECKGNDLLTLPHDMKHLTYLESDFEELGEGNQADEYHKLRLRGELPVREN